MADRGVNRPAGRGVGVCGITVRDRELHQSGARAVSPECVEVCKPSVCVSSICHRPEFSFIIQEKGMRNKSSLKATHTCTGVQDFLPALAS